MFPEAPFESRVAQKFRDDVHDDETERYLRQTLGVDVGKGANGEGRGRSDDTEAVGLEDSGEEEKEDDDFDQEEEGVDDDDSLAEDVDEEHRLGRERIARDELDALSVESDADPDDDEGDDASDGGGSSGEENGAVRRSRRRRFAIPSDGGGTSGDSDDGAGKRAKDDAGALDVANIVPGKRRRAKVDYRKLADAMFGDEPDEDAKGARKEYTYRPRKKARGRSRNDDEDGDDSDDGSSMEEDKKNPADVEGDDSARKEAKGRKGGDEAKSK